jgi:hypothetical protein
MDIFFAASVAVSVPLLPAEESAGAAELLQAAKDNISVNAKTSAKTFFMI